jgi:hypothetical protein
MSWARQHRVVLGGLFLIAIQIAWKAQDLRHLYFLQDDYVNLDKAIESPFDWHYLTLVGAGHLYPGLRAITWVLARISLYNWGLDTSVLLALLACACLAALRLLRTLFGDRPAILIPLGVYLLTPLTVPDLGWWWCGMESVPFQLAIFMTLNAHVQYIRTERGRHLAAASVWLAVAMLFFEKAMVLPLLLFAVTACFLMGTRSWLAGAARTLIRHWRAWVVYGFLMVAYAVMFVEAFRASATHLSAPKSASAGLTFAWVLVKTTLLTGAIGGPWRWLVLPGGLYAIAAPPAIGIWLARVTCLLVIVASVAIRPIAWRAWAILAGWIVLADMVPVLLGRLEHGLAGLLGLETRYLADAACVLAICIGLAFLPVTGVKEATPQVGLRRRLRAGARQLRYAAAGLVGVFVVGSIQSVHAYEADTKGATAPIAYIKNAEQALKHAGRGTNVVNARMPAKMVSGIFEQYALESRVIGDLERGRLAGKLRWITSADGTIDDLQIFGPDGRLYPAAMSGVSSLHRKQTGFKACWPEKNGVIVVWFTKPTSIFDWTLKLNYIWGGGPSSILVEYNGREDVLEVRHGLHSGYLPVSGSVKSFMVSGLGNDHLCVGYAVAGHLMPF